MTETYMQKRYREDAEFRQRCKANAEAYQKTDKDKACQKAYYEANNDKDRAYQKAYKKSDRYKAYQKAYKKAYQKSDKYKAYNKAYQKDYYQNVIKPRMEKEAKG